MNVQEFAAPAALVGLLVGGAVWASASFRGKNQVLASALLRLRRCGEAMDSSEAVMDEVQHVIHDISELESWGAAVRQKGAKLRVSDSAAIQELANRVSASLRRIQSIRMEPHTPQMVVVDLNNACATIEKEVNRVVRAIDGRITNSVTRQWATLTPGPPIR